MKAVLLSCGTGAWYPLGVARLTKSFKDKGWNHTIRTWVNQLPDGSRPHNEIPYHFKAMAFAWARSAGYDIAIWADAAVYAYQNPEKLFPLIEKDGYMILRNGWTTGEWSTDAQLEAFGHTREDGMNIPHAMACVIGIDLRTDIGKNIIEDYINNSHLFPGAWSNKNNEVSPDNRVLGSRHDQSVLSLIAHKYNCIFTPPQGIISYATDATDCILLTQGM